MPADDDRPVTVTEIPPGATGMWFMGDVSGCIHTLDFDENVYIVWMPGWFGLEDGEDDPEFDPEGTEFMWIFDEIIEWPRVNGTLKIEGGLVDGEEVSEMLSWAASDYLTWIAPMPAGVELGDMTVTEFEAVTQVPPPSAWLLIGDEASMPTPEDMESGDLGESNLWTGPQMAQRGDIVFIYFIAPTKEIRYAARVLDSPFFNPDSEINSLDAVSPKQWWVELSEFVEVPL